MNDVELSIRMTADATEAANAMEGVGDAALRMGDDVDRGSREADAATDRLDNVAGAADNVASKGAQAGGALTGLGELVGGPFGAAMQTGGVATMAMADAGDLLNVVTESNIVRKIKDTAVTIAQRTATLATAAATRVMTAAQWALNAAMRANPIGLAITAALGLAGLFVLLYKRSDRFRAIVKATMDASRKAIGYVVAALKLVGKVLVTYLMVQWKIYSTLVKLVWKGIQVVVRVVVAAIKAYLNAYKVVAIAVWNTVRDVAVRVWGAITSYVGDKVRAIRELAATIRTKFTEVWGGVQSKAEGVFSALTAPIQRIIDLVDSVLDKIGKIKLPDLNPLNGRVAAPGSTVPVGGSSSTAGGTVININVTTGVGDPLAIADSISTMLNRRVKFLGVA